MKDYAWKLVNSVTAKGNIFAFLIHAVLLTGFFQSSLPAASSEASEWTILYECDHEKNAVGDRIWESMGSSGPQGGSFAGVTGKTSSAFDGGWHGYELRLGNGESMRENYFWMCQPLKNAKGNAIFFQLDFMADGSSEANAAAFEIFGGEKNGSLGRQVFTVSFGNSQAAITGKDKKAKKISDIKPHTWYRLEIELRASPEKSLFAGTAAIRENGVPEAKCIQIEIPMDEKAFPLQNMKLSYGRMGGKTGGPVTELYFDNIILKTKNIEGEK